MFRPPSNITADTPPRKLRRIRIRFESLRAAPQASRRGKTRRRVPFLKRLLSKHAQLPESYWFYRLVLITIESTVRCACSGLHRPGRRLTPASLERCPSNARATVDRRLAQ